jgi:hypothetical protein
MNNIQFDDAGYVTFLLRTWTDDNGCGREDWGAFEVVKMPLASQPDWVSVVCSDKFNDWGSKTFESLLTARRYAFWADQFRKGQTMREFDPSRSYFWEA